MLAIKANCEPKQHSEASGESAGDPIQQGKDGSEPASKSGMGDGTVAGQKGKREGGERRVRHKGPQAGWP